MSAASRGWSHLRSSIKRSHHSNSKPYTMRNTAMIPRLRALSLQAAGRARLQIERHSGIDRLARNRSQTRKSRERTQGARVAGFPQRVLEGAIGTKNRNERRVTHLDGFDGLTQDPSVQMDAEIRRRTMDGMAGAITCWCEVEEKSKSEITAWGSRRGVQASRFPRGGAHSADVLGFRGRWWVAPTLPENMLVSLIIRQRSLADAGGATRSVGTAFPRGTVGTSGTHEKMQRISRFSPPFSPGISGHGEQTKSWCTGLYGGRNTALGAVGRFS